MPEKKYEWHRIADASALSLAAGEIRLISVARKKLCVTTHNGRLYAFSSKCPHAGGNLTAGHVDAHGNIVCPVHRYKYCLRNGFNVSGEGFYLKTYPLEYREDGIYAGFASDSLWDFFRK